MDGWFWKQGLRGGKITWMGKSKTLPSREKTQIDRIINRSPLHGCREKELVRDDCLFIAQCNVCFLACGDIRENYQSSKRGKKVLEGMHACRVYGNHRFTCACVCVYVHARVAMKRKEVKKMLFANGAIFRPKFFRFFAVTFF